jgi:hypothetical protein
LSGGAIQLRVSVLDDRSTVGVEQVEGDLSQDIDKQHTADSAQGDEPDAMTGAGADSIG